MKTLIRWSKFNLVGVLGMGVQLTALTLLNRYWRDHYLFTSSIALELTLLHNFVWHQRFTWRERRELSPWPGQLLRFHLSNGLVSLAGNLMMVRVLVHEAHVRVLVANVIAILCCSIVNFYVGNRWAFADIQMPPLSASEADKLTNIPVRKLPLRSHYYRVQIEVRT